MARQQALLEVQQENNRIRESHNREMIRIQEEDLADRQSARDFELEQQEHRMNVIRTAREMAQMPEGTPGRALALSEAVGLEFSQEDIFGRREPQGDRLAEANEAVVAARGEIAQQLDIMAASENVETSDAQVAPDPRAMAELGELRQIIAGGGELTREQALRHNELAAQTRRGTITKDDLFQFGRNWVLKLQQRHPDIPVGFFSGMVSDLLNEKAPLLFTEQDANDFGRMMGVQNEDVGDVEVPELEEGSIDTGRSTGGEVTVKAGGPTDPSQGVSGRPRGGPLSAAPSTSPVQRSTPGVQINPDGTLTTAAQRQLESLVARAMELGDLA
jgi:hypothetical protein